MSNWDSLLPTTLNCKILSSKLSVGSICNLVIKHRLQYVGELTEHQKAQLQGRRYEISFTIYPVRFSMSVALSCSQQESRKDTLFKTNSSISFLCLLVELKCYFKSLLNLFIGVYGY